MPSLYLSSYGCAPHFRTARPSKVEDVRARYKGTVQVFAVTDLADGDYSEAMKGEPGCTIEIS